MPPLECRLKEHLNLTTASVQVPSSTARVFPEYWACNGILVFLVPRPDWKKILSFEKENAHATLISCVLKAFNSIIVNDSILRVSDFAVRLTQLLLYPRTVAYVQYILVRSTYISA